jgi:hypothetical protein
VTGGVVSLGEGLAEGLAERLPAWASGTPPPTETVGALVLAGGEGGTVEALVATL